MIYNVKIHLERKTCPQMIFRHNRKSFICYSVSMKLKKNFFTASQSKAPLAERLHKQMKVFTYPVKCSFSTALSIRNDTTQYTGKKLFCKIKCILKKIHLLPALCLVYAWVFSQHRKCYIFSPFLFFFYTVLCFCTSNKPWARGQGMVGI